MPFAQENPESEDFGFFEPLAWQFRQIGIIALIGSRKVMPLDEVALRRQ